MRIRIESLKSLELNPRYIGRPTARENMLKGIMDEAKGIYSIKTARKEMPAVMEKPSPQDFMRTFLFQKNRALFEALTGKEAPDSPGEFLEVLKAEAAKNPYYQLLQNQKKELERILVKQQYAKANLNRPQRGEGIHMGTSNARVGAFLKEHGIEGAFTFERHVVNGSLPLDYPSILIKNQQKQPIAKITFSNGDVIHVQNLKEKTNTLVQDGVELGTFPMPV